MIALLLVIASCARPLPPVTRPIAPQSAESLQLRSVVRAWNERGDLPYLDGDGLFTLMVTDAATAEVFADACGAHAVGCLTGWDRCTEPFGGLLCGRDHLAVVSPAQRSAGSRLSIVRHEAVHYAAELAGISDPVHRDRRLWAYGCRGEPTCIVTAVEERARFLANGGDHGSVQ